MPAEEYNLIIVILTTVIATTAVLTLFFSIYVRKEKRKAAPEKQRRNNLKLSLLERFIKFMERRDREEKKEKTDREKAEERETQNAYENYLGYMYQKHRYLDFTGLNAILQNPLLLENIYVKLSAKREVKREFYISIQDFQRLHEKEEAGEPEEEPAREIGAVFQSVQEEAQRSGQPPRMAVLGHPGSGKTTLMKWILLQNANGSNSDIWCYCPVLLFLKDLAKDPAETYRKRTLIDTAATLLAKYLGKEIDQLLQEKFRKNRVLFLLDGLDEVADEKVRREVIVWIQDQDLKNNALIVTSRFSGVQPSKGLAFDDSFPIFAIQDFREEDTKAFVTHWYANIERALGGEKSQSESAKEAEKQSAHLIAAIFGRGQSQLRELSVNPLLLTIIAIVHRTRAILPKERHKLYEEALKVMIELWNMANRKIEISYSLDNSIDCLSQIARYLMVGNRREMSPNELQTLLPESIEGQPWRFFIDEMVLKAGILYRSEGGYGFLHLTFQEYLTALYYAKQRDQTEILAYRKRDYWENTFRLFANVGHIQQLFEEVSAGLVKKKYCHQMTLWEEMLREVTVEKLQSDLEKELAAKCFEELAKIESGEKNRQVVLSLCYNYPTMQWAKNFQAESWQLFRQTKHPEIKSFATLMLHRCGGGIQRQIVDEVKANFMGQKEKERRTLEEKLSFLNEFYDLVPILIASRRLEDIKFIVRQIDPANDAFLSLFLIVRLRYLRELLDLRGMRELLDKRDLRDMLGLLDLRDLRDLRYLRYLLDLRYLRYLRYLRDYIDRNKQKLLSESETVVDWRENTLKRLDGLSSEDIIKYFPHTAKEEYPSRSVE